MGFPTTNLPRNLLTLCSVFVFVQILGVEGEPLTLSVDVTTALHITDRRYLSVTISGGQLRKGLVGYDFSSPKFQNLAAALAPADVRIGGTYSDFLHFDPTSDEANCVNVTAIDSADEGDDDEETSLEEAREEKQENFAMGQLQYTFSGARWDNMTKFCDQVGWDILWDFNLLDSMTQPWDPNTAKEFLEFSAERGIRIPMFELGNEPNLYDRKFGVDINATKLAGDIHTLKDIVSEMPQYSTSGIYAPGVSNVGQFATSRKYLAEFLSARGCEYITEVALHHYYFRADEAKESDFWDLDVLNGLKTELEVAYNISWSNCRVKRPLRLTETSSASGGGVPKLSNAYAAGFLWLDKLGLSATYGITRVYRQTFLKSAYALVSQKHKPNPDYYTSLLFKRLVEGPVFRVSEDELSRTVRIYAHCVGQSYYDYPDGAIVIYYLNIGEQESVLSLGEYAGTPVDLFILTPGDENGMQSRKMNLNAELINMKTDDLPLLDPKPHTGDVVLPPRSYGFIVIPQADAELCKQYHRIEKNKFVSC